MALDNFTIDLTTYKDRFGSRVPEGTYRVKVDDAEVTTAKSGSTMINLWYMVQGGEYHGTTIVDRVVLTEKAMFRVVAVMHALGLPTDRKKYNLNTQHLVGRVMDVTVEDGEPYNGNIRSEVRSYARAAAVSSPVAEDVDDFGFDGGSEDVASEPPTTAAEPEAPTAPVAAEPAQPVAEELPQTPAPVPHSVNVTSSQVSDDVVDLDDLDELA